MSDKTGIEWTDATWNPIRGCSRVSAGCMHCYAERVAGRFSGPGQPYEGVIGSNGTWNGVVKLVDKHLLDPLRWQRPRRIFVNSMSDLFHENVSFDWVDQIFAVMALSPRHTFQVLTKRPARMREYFAHAHRDTIVDAAAMSLHPDAVACRAKGENWTRAGYEHLLPAPQGKIVDFPAVKLPLPNVWLGVSVEDQATADARIDELLLTPAAVRFVSYEPALGPVDFSHWGVHGPRELPSIGAWRRRDGTPVLGIRPRLDWIICGGESGDGARPMHPDWARSVRDQCVAAGVPFFFKQWGEWCPPVSGVAYNTAKGRAQKTPAFIVDHAGLVHCFHHPSHERPQTMIRIGKKRSGRILDGTQWHQMPAHSAIRNPQSEIRNHE